MSRVDARQLRPGKQKGEKDESGMRNWIDSKTGGLKNIELYIDCIDQHCTVSDCIGLQ